MTKTTGVFIVVLILASLVPTIPARAQTLLGGRAPIFFIATNTGLVRVSNGNKTLAFPIAAGAIKVFKLHRNIFVLAGDGELLELRLSNNLQRVESEQSLGNFGSPAPNSFVVRSNEVLASSGCGINEYDLRGGSLTLVSVHPVGIVTDIKLDSQGRLYFLDPFLEQIKVVQPASTGELDWTSSQAIALNDRLINPTTLGIGGKDRVIVGSAAEGAANMPICDGEGVLQSPPGHPEHIFSRVQLVLDAEPMTLVEGDPLMPSGASALAGVGKTVYFMTPTTSGGFAIFATSTRAPILTSGDNEVWNDFIVVQ